MKLSIIIPTLNAQTDLPVCLDAIQSEAANAEIIVADGGSVDATRQIAVDAGCSISSAVAGRGGQLHAGANEATGDWLLFLHADTRLEKGWRNALEAFVRNGTDKAGYFGFRLDDKNWRARVLEFIVYWRCKLFALPYGDQALFISSKAYAELGGYKPIPLMEDVELVKRLGRRRLVMIDHRAVTSAAKYQQSGYVVRMCRNAFCLTLYFAGVSPDRIKAVYQ